MATTKTGADDRERSSEKDAGTRGAASRVDAFRRLAEARAAGEMVMMPRMLTGHDRRVHVRQTLREDHQTRIADHRTEAGDKFDKLARSRFSFFRGTALLFYRDLAGEDAWMPTVLALGDVHPENFGVMPSRENVPLFGVNDVDEAFYAPFTWDLRRGAVGFLVAGQDKGGLGRSKRRTVAGCFLRGYVDGITEYAAKGTEEVEQLRLDNAPPLVTDLIGQATKQGREAWLAQDYLDEHRRGFRVSRKLVPLSSRRAEFQKVVDRYAKGNGVDEPGRTPGLRVKDVAERHGQGTASLGLTRYYVLLEGPRADGTDDVVLELKQARRSALAGLVPPSPYLVSGQGDRVAHAERVQLVGGDPYYGSVDHEGLSFLVRERSPFRDDISLKKLSTSQWREYARICGRVLAHAHALSDEAGAVDHDVEPAVVASIGEPELFVEDLLDYAEEAADQLARDHRYFVADHARGAFSHVDVHYR